MSETSDRSAATDAFRLDELEPAPTLQQITPDRRHALVAEGLGRTVETNFFEPTLDLSARRPYDPVNGRLDIVQIGRWNTDQNLIHMKPISSGSGSMGYGIFYPQ